jgi:dUTPase
MDVNRNRIHHKIGHINDWDCLQVKRLSTFATVPTRATELSAGVDLSSAQNAVIPSGGRALVLTDLIIKCPYGTYGRISSRRYGIGELRFANV